MRSVYIADIKNTAVSSGAMFCPPIIAGDSLEMSSLLPIQTSGLQSRQDMWVSLLRRVCELQGCKKFPKRPLNDEGVLQCSLESMTPMIS
ncbi:hypothetical protein CY34DRAFT_806493 [Suillus luteus UH-Slu-Lm8-n1]|uniref:Uncharacterized protein n=1 Tax=Suillus luteus UH-Slu-Lm8-n1 TaxID=930992 RepID=A0A0D0BCB9_9AGAM|nr:hypothetical protein CY34DRAFT_806493 [Suillus luteus UH-Slu-Lm8-n1]